MENLSEQTCVNDLADLLKDIVMYYLLPHRNQIKNMDEHVNLSSGSGPLIFRYRDLGACQSVNFKFVSCVTSQEVCGFLFSTYSVTLYNAEGMVGLSWTGSDQISYRKFSSST